MFVALGLIALSVATAMVLKAFRGHMVLFYSPSDVLANETVMDRTFRLGGMVEDGSLVRESDGLAIRFEVTVLANIISVTCIGTPHDLFRGGQGVVAQGRNSPD